MPFCHECNYEFRSDIKTCPHCKVELNEQPSADLSEVEDYTEIYTVANRMEASVIKSILDEAEVNYLVRDLRSFPVMPDPGGRRAKLRIAVPRSKAEQARKVLKEAQEDGALTVEGGELL